MPCGEGLACHAGRGWHAMRGGASQPIPIEGEVSPHLVLLQLLELLLHLCQL